MKRDIGLLLIGTCFGIFLCSVGAFLLAYSYKPEVPKTIITVVYTATKQATKISTPTITSTPRPTYTPRPTSTPEIGSIRNPIPLGQSIYLVQNDIAEFEIHITNIVRGNDAWKTIYSANEFNERAPDGMEYLIAEVQVSHYGNDSEILELNDWDWKIETNNRYFDPLDSFICCVSPEFDVKLGSGGIAVGLLIRPVYIDDDSPILVFGDKYYFSTK